MKTKTYIVGILLIMVSFYAKADHTMAQDTIIIQFGNNSKIVIVTNNSDEIKDLKKYDLNKIINELNMSIDDSGETKYLVIEDESGKKYLKDKTINIKDDDGDGVSIDISNGNVNIHTSDDDNDNVNINFKTNKYRDYSKKRTKHFFNIEIGTSNWFEDGGFASGVPYTVRPWGSWYVGFSSLQKTSLGGPLFIEWGPSLNWYNWKFEDESTRISEDNGIITFTSTADNNPDNVDFIKSKLTASHLNFSLVPVLDFSYGKKTIERDGTRKKITVDKRNGIRVGLGAYAGLRLGSKTKVVVNDGGRSRNKDRDDFLLSNFRYGVRAQFGFRGLDFFANYDLNNVFQDNAGPELNAFSFGLIF